MSYVNRDLFTADGHEWWEPRWHELQEILPAEEACLIKPTKCTSCHQTQPARSVVHIMHIRDRGWKPEHYADMAGTFSAWSQWKVYSLQCSICAFSGGPFGASLW